MISIIVAVGLLAILMFAGVPVAFGLLIAGSAGLYVFGGLPLVKGILSTAPASAIESYEFLTVPMFLLMAEFLIASGISLTLFEAILAWTGRVRGGLAVASALTGAMFGAISGSSSAAAATLSTAGIPAMVRAGYDQRFASGVVAISGTLAMLIPPSVALVFYGLLSGTSVARLLIAGVVPGIMLTLVIVLTVRFLIWRNPGLAPEDRTYSLGEKIASLKVAGPILFLFALVTGTIYTGIATPVEASSLGAAGAFVYAVATGKLTRRTAMRAIASAVSTTAMIGLIVSMAQVFGYFITITQITQSLVAYVAQLQINPAFVIAFVVVLYLVLGAFLDQLSILILTIPITLPIMQSLGFDPIWFGILVIVLAEIGMVTPPVGLNVYIVARKTGLPVESVFYGVWPHVAAHIVFIILLIVFPQIALWLPSTMMK